MSVRVRISSGSQETGALLTTLLQERGILDQRNGEGYVGYGYPCGTRNKAINGVGSGGKISSLKAWTAAGIRTVPWFQAGDPIPKDFRFPALARNNHGQGGTDIKPVFQAKEIPWRTAAGFDWFSSYVPVDTEYRVWIFRGQCLDVYEKVMQRPHEYTGVAGRNFAQGFEFKLVAKPPQDAVDLATAAVEAVKYDFGAVDMLRGEDGLLYILENNSAPGVLRSKAEATLVKFVDCIEAWDKAGHPSYD